MYRKYYLFKNYMVLFYMKYILLYM